MDGFLSGWLEDCCCFGGGEEAFVCERSERGERKDDVTYDVYMNEEEEKKLKRGGKVRVIIVF